MVLAACSTHFENLFSHAPVNAPSHSQLFVILDGTRADDLQVLLQFMYKGEAYLHQDRINSVLRTAEVLQIKGLTQGPNEISEKNLSGGASILGTPSASNARWTPTHESPPHRAPVGIMGHMRTSHIRKEPREPPPRDLHRDLVDASPPPPPHHLLPGSSHHSGSGHHASRSAISPDHATFVYPTSRAGENFSPYGTGSRFSLPNFSRSSSNRDYSPTSQIRDRSPPPERGRSYGSAAGTPTLVPKEEREEFYDHRPGNSGSRSGSLSHHDRNTPASDKASERHTPASHHGDRDREYDPPPRGSSRNSPPSPVATPSSLGKSTPAAFPSDSTSDYAKAASSSNFKERIRRSSDSAATVTPGAGLAEDGNDAERSKFHEYRREADQTLRVRSPSGGRSGKIGLSILCILFGEIFSYIGTSRFSDFPNCFWNVCTEMLLCYRNANV